MKDNGSRMRLHFVYPKDWGNSLMVCSACKKLRVCVLVGVGDAELVSLCGEDLLALPKILERRFPGLFFDIGPLRKAMLKMSKVQPKGAGR
jgi:hypothetical protein